MGCGVGGWGLGGVVGGVGGGTMAKIITFHVDAKGFYIHSYMSCINSKWLNRVGGRSSVGWGVGGNYGKDNDIPCGCKGLLHSFK